jgi:hypothetical protein
MPGELSELEAALELDRHVLLLEHNGLIITYAASMACILTSFINEVLASILFRDLNEPHKIRLLEYQP